ADDELLQVELDAREHAGEAVVPLLDSPVRRSLTRHRVRAGEPVLGARIELLDDEAIVAGVQPGEDMAEAPPKNEMVHGKRCRLARSTSGSQKRAGARSRARRGGPPELDRCEASRDGTRASRRGRGPTPRREARPVAARLACT